MAKMYSKSDLKFEDGYVLTYDDEVVALPDKVAQQINEIETILQKQMYLAGQPKATPVPSLDGFERKSIVDLPEVKVSTPALDELEEMKRKVLDDVRNEMSAAAVNKIIQRFPEAFSFFKKDKFVEGSEVVMIDAPTLNNVLTVDADALVSIIAERADIDCLQ